MPAPPAPPAPPASPAMPAMPAPPELPIPPEVIIDAARGGLQYLVKQAEKSQTARDRQVAKLDQQIEQIQRLLDAGRYDEAEVRLVDIHWHPVESARSEGLEIRQYDEKREALMRFLIRKRAPKPVP